MEEKIFKIYHGGHEIFLIDIYILFYLIYNKNSLIQSEV